MPSLFSHSASPLYAQLAEVLRERIIKGVWPMKSRIPTLPELSKEFGVALITVRMAVQLLKEEQLLVPEQGRGTYVLRKPATHPKMKVESSLKELSELYTKFPPKVIPIAEGKRRPKLTPNEGSEAADYHFLHRTHATRGRLNSVISAYIDESIFKLAPKRFRKELIIPVLMSLDGISIGSAKQTLTISTAGIETSKALGIAISAPVAELRRVICDTNNTVIYVGELTYRGDFIRLEMDLLA